MIMLESWSTDIRIYGWIWWNVFGRHHFTTPVRTVNNVKYVKYQPNGKWGRRAQLK